jgi:hypothetical protein
VENLKTKNLTKINFTQAREFFHVNADLPGVQEHHKNRDVLLEEKNNNKNYCQARAFPPLWLTGIT